MSAPVAYVVGQWVSGARFYGRRREIAELLGGAGRAAWVAGLRRVGKTSLLRQLELEAPAGAGAPALPVLLDLQGVDAPAELGHGFADAVLDAGAALRRQGIDPAPLGERAGAGDLGGAAERWLAGARAAGARPLLLCDEADELADLAARSPEVVAAVADLWRAVLEAPGGRVVVASSVRLCDRAAREPAVSALLAGLAPPLLLGALPDADARDLALQTQLPPAGRPRLDEAGAAAISDEAGNHPMLIQLLGKRAQELGSLADAVRELEADRTVAHLFAADSALLRDEERQLLRAIAAGGVAPHAPALREATRLRALGLVRDGEGGTPLIAGRRFAAWLRT